MQKRDKTSNIIYNNQRDVKICILLHMILFSFISNIIQK